VNMYTDNWTRFSDMFSENVEETENTIISFLRKNPRPRVGVFSAQEAFSNRVPSGRDEEKPKTRFKTPGSDVLVTNGNALAKHVRYYYHVAVVSVPTPFVVGRIRAYGIETSFGAKSSAFRKFALFSSYVFLRLPLRKTSSLTLVRTLGDALLGPGRS